MDRKRPLFLLAALLAVLMLGVSACGGEEGDEEAAPEEPAAEQEITLGFGTEPPSLDPGLATDTTSANVIFNIMDPLIKLNEDLEPEPNVAESWEISEDGTTITYHLIQDAGWTNGDPLTAHDYEYAWKRTISPQLAADYAYQFYGVEGAQDYNGCTPPNSRKCRNLRDEVGIRAVDDHTLEVTLTSAQPWFVAQSGHTSFMPVHRETVEQFGDQWTEPENIVTSGPFTLEEWVHDQSITLVKWDEWRNADEVALTRVEGRIIPDPVTMVQAYQAGEITAFEGGGLPPDQIDQLKQDPGYELYEYLGTYFYGFNTENITDVNQRRAMSLAIDRQSVIDNVAKGDQEPAAGFTPPGIPGFEDVYPNSPWAPAEGDMEQAQQLMDQVENAKTRVNLFHNEAPGHREIAVAVQDMWNELGLDTTIKAMEWAQYLEFIGPPPNRGLDVYRLGWIYDYPDPINGLELWTCESGFNSPQFCNEEYDSLIEQARDAADDAERFGLYAQAEQILFGEDGEVPLAPIYHYTLQNLENPCIKETYFIHPLNQTDLAEVRVEGEC